MAATFKFILAPLRLIIISYRNHQFMLVQIYLIVMTGFCMIQSIVLLIIPNLLKQTGGSIKNVMIQLI